jgi:hypothetical protein
MPSASPNSTDQERIAAFLCLGRMAILVMPTHNKEAVAAVAAIVISHITEVRSAFPMQLCYGTLSSVPMQQNQITCIFIDASLRFGELCHVWVRRTIQPSVV